MVTIISLAVLATLLSLSAFQAVKNNRNSGYVDVKSAMIPRLMAALAVMVLCDLLCPGHDAFRILADSVIAVMSVSMTAVSVRPVGRLPFHIFALPVPVPLLTLYYILCAAGVMNVPEPPFLLALSVLTLVFHTSMFIWMIWKKLRDVKAVMKAGNAWSFVTLCTDIIYFIIPLSLISVLYMVYVSFPEAFTVSATVAVLLMTMEVAAIVLRVSYDSAFVILHDHERLIVESMKIAHMDAPAASGMKGDEAYKELYERIVLYFEMSKPYLDGNLTINDLVKVVYSNKVYISKAICHYTGRNFRQFVNYHRIMYSMDLFRSNLELKVADLSEKSGFNTVVSYTMAFRLFMNETPSEWCRKERSKILKPKK